VPPGLDLAAFLFGKVGPILGQIPAMRLMGVIENLLASDTLRQ
jgi:hypothetical protein